MSLIVIVIGLLLAGYSLGIRRVERGIARASGRRAMRGRSD